jgi:hypothetical protein
MVRTDDVERLTHRRGLTPLGCLGVGLGILAIVAAFSILTAYLTWRNFGDALVMARDEIQPVGEQFIRLLSQEAYQPAYGLLTDECRKEWPPERFAELAARIGKDLGPVHRIDVDVLALTFPEIARNKDQAIEVLPMTFVCKFERGEGTFDLFFRASAGSDEEGSGKREWKISSVAFDPAEPESPPGES